MSSIPISLENISVATPCPANWSDMTGDDKMRFCSQCQLNVYNLSGMTRQEAETLIQEKEGRLCIRYFQRADGTIITQDCPVGLKTLHRRKITRIGTGVAAAITLITVCGMFTSIAHAEHTMGKPSIEWRGEAQVQQSPPSTQTPQPQPNIREIKGDVAPVTPPPKGTLSPCPNPKQDPHKH